MNNVVTLIDRHDCIFYAFKHTSHKPQKGPTCLYYAMNYIRIRYRHIPPLEGSEGRAIEKIVSSWRKALTTDYHLRKVADERLEDLIMYVVPHGSTICKKTIIGTAKKIAQTKLPLDIRKALIVHGKEFQKSNARDFLGFLETKIRDAHKKSIDISLDLLKNLNLVALISFFNKPTLCSLDKKGHSFFAFHPPLKSNLQTNLTCFRLAARAIAFVYQLTPSKWKKEHGIQALISALKEKGPMVTQSCVGQSYYLDKEEKSRCTLANYPLFYFPKGAKRNPEMKNFHAIVIVGAQIIDHQKLVYFLDPRDDNRDVAKIHVASYQTLTGYMFHPIGHSIQFWDLSKDKNATTWPACYGFHAPSKS